MPIWIFFSVAAAFVQAMRFMLQKQLSMGGLTPAGATFARFAFSSPLIWVILAVYTALAGVAFPSTSPLFWGYAVVGGISQILATICVVALFKERNFAVGITFKKTEVIQTAIVGFVVLGDALSSAAILAILIGFVGVIILSDPPEGGSGKWYARITNKAAALGLASGVLFGFSATFYRGASLNLGLEDPLFRAGVTLGFVTLIQTAVMAVWMQMFQQGQVAKVLGNWRKAGLVGITSMIGSYCWFTAFTLQNAAYVKAVGQIELIFSFLIGVFVFREKTKRREFLAMGLIALSILVLVIGA